MCMGTRSLLKFKMTGQICIFILTFFLVPVFSFAVLSAPQSIICPELGPILEDLTSPGFEHISQQPQCVDQILPSLILYTRNDTEIGCNLLHLDNPNYNYSLSESCSENIKNIKKVVFIVHGFQMYQSSHLLKYEEIKDGILKQENVGVIVVDWYEGAKIDLSLIGNSSFSSIMKDFVNFEPYHQAASNTRYMGTALARIIENIRNATANNEIQPNNVTNDKDEDIQGKIEELLKDGSESQIFFYCIGHSLGAHVCGFAGKALKKISAKPMDRISGLDPAGPLFVQSGIAAHLDINNYPKVHLSSGDADFVDTIHTDSSWLGSFTKMGHYDFYVGERKENETKFGYDQPAARDCFQGSHSLSKDYFLATIDNECEVEEVCTNINLNKTEGCHDAIGLGIKMGYQTTPSAKYKNGYFPVQSDKQGLSCLNNKIKVEAEKVPHPIMKELIRLKEVCSIISGLIPSIGKAVKDMFSKWEESIQAVEETRVELEVSMNKMSKIVSKIDAQNKPIRIAFAELEKVDALYEEEKTSLRLLAENTVRSTRRLIRKLQNILDPNVKVDGYNIKRVISNIEILLEESTEKLSEARTNLKEIQNKYITISVNLNKTNEAIEHFEKEGKELITDVTERMIKITENKMLTSTDKMTAYYGIFKIFHGVGMLLNDDDVSKVDLLTYIPKIVDGASKLYGEWSEYEKEKLQVGMMNKTASALKKVLQKEMRKINKTLYNIKEKIDQQKDDIKKRVTIVIEWISEVGFIKKTYGKENYIELEKAMMNELHKEDVQYLIDDFTKLKMVAEKYIKLPK